MGNKAEVRGAMEIALTVVVAILAVCLAILEIQKNQKMREL